jgi:predicted regulator of Ras-like GTPase activity (Roadblock/LC7/MglB family)
MLGLRIEGMGNKMENITESLVRLLVDLRTRTGIRASTLLHIDGTPIAEDLPAEIDRESIHAMVAAINGSSNRFALNLGYGTVTTLIMYCEEGIVVLKKINSNILSILSGRERNLGLILHELDRISKQIINTLSAPLKVEIDREEFHKKLGEIERSEVFKELIKKTEKRKEEGEK